MAEKYESLLGACLSKPHLMEVLVSWSASDSFCAEVFTLLKDIQDKYHNGGSSPWSDKLYDLIVDTLRDNFNIDVESAYIGSAVSHQDSVQLPYYMGSMNKFKTQKLVHAWMKKYRGPYIVSAKLDGVSAMLSNGKLYTRGNGTRGRDISYLLPFLNLPNLNGTVCARGELIMRKSVFQHVYSHAFANPRNLVCGLLNRTFDPNDHAYKHIDFVAYDVYTHSQTPSSYEEKFDLLKSKGLRVVAHKRKIESLPIDKCDALLKTWMASEFDYMIDGIIVSNYNKHYHGNANKNPEFAFAYKNNDLSVDMQVGVVEIVRWNVSKDNYLKPTIQLQTPILCEQSKVEYVTGFNAKYIVDKRIKKGSRVKIGLSGNVIPHIFQVLNTGEVVEGDAAYLTNVDCSYEWSKNHVDIICNEKDNYQRAIKQNMQLFIAFDMKCNLQEKTLHNIYESLGIYHLADILSLTLEDMIQVNKMGEKKATGILGAFHDTLHWPHVSKEPDFQATDYFLKLCLGLQCFDRGFAMKKIQLYVTYLRTLNGIDFKKFSENNYIETKKDFILRAVAVRSQKQITTTTMCAFLEGFQLMNIKINSLIESNLPFNLAPMKKLLSAMSIVVTEKADKNGDEFVFSGFRNEAWANEIRKRGGCIGERVTKNTSALVVKDKSKPTGKIKQAESFGVPVYTDTEFITRYKNQYKGISS